MESIISGLYRAAAGEQPWGVPLEALRQKFGAWAVQLHGLDPKLGGVVFSYEVGNFPADCALAYIQHYHKIDPRTARLLSGAPGEWTSCHHLFDDEFVAHNRFYQDFLIPYGGRYVSGAKVFESEDLIAFLGIHRGRGMQPLDDKELDSGRRIGLHVNAALALWQRHGAFASQHLLGQTVLQHLPHPIFLMDEQLRVRVENPAAEAWLRQSPSMSLQAGRLVFGRQATQTDVMLALRRLRLSGTESYRDDSPAPARSVIRVQGEVGDAPSCLILTALRAAENMGAFGPQNLAMGVIHDAGRRAPVDRFLAATLFRLTPAEANVALAMADGRAPEDVALEFGVAVSTIRAQLKAVYAKVGVKRQSDLVSALRSLPPLIE